MEVQGRKQASRIFVKLTKMFVAYMNLYIHIMQTPGSIGG